MKLNPEWRVTIEHVPTGLILRLALIKQIWEGRYWLRFNGRASEEMPECTKTKFLKKIGEILQSR